MTTKKVYIVHGWGGSPEEGWFPWLKAELIKHGVEAEILEMPNTEEPKIDEWVNFLANKVLAVDDNTFFVGHSIGCQTILRYLETIKNKKIGGVILVAGWFKLVGLESEEEWAIAKPWLETPINFSNIKNLTSNFTAILSTNDSFVDVTENKKMLSEDLGAKIIIENNKGHFSGSDGIVRLEVVLDELLKWIK